MDILFPYDEIRKEQDRLVDDILNNVKSKKNMIIHAPTGIGKTAAVFSATLKHAMDSKKTIFFVTSKNMQHKIAIETLKKIKDKFKLNLVVSDFIGKKWMCLIPGVAEMMPAEFYDYCKEHIERGTCDFYNNVKSNNKLSVKAHKVLDEMKEKIMSVDEMIRLCSENGLCPHEIAMLHAQNADVIVADYFHILSSPIRDNLLKRSKKELNETIIIMDEGHNLPERCKDLLSCQISTFIIDKAAKEIRQIGSSDVADDAEGIKDILYELNRNIGLVETERLVKKEEFYNAVNEITNYGELVKYLKKLGDELLDEKKRSYANSLASFMENWLGPDEGFARILKRGFTRKDKLNVSLFYKCLDPSIVMKQIASEANIIIMSGTLSPTSIYRDLLGFDAELKEYEDPFPEKNRLNLIFPEITTKFSERDNEMYNKIGIATAKIANNIPGNSIIFFPSYQLINNVYQYFNNICEKTIFMERPKLSKMDKEYVIENFKKYKERGAVLLACASGSFGESIDLPGDYLKAVLVVGLPLSKPDLEVKETIKYYDKRFGNGWDYGYIFPALITCIQNAGRCIRTESDRGVIIFLDSRYCMEKYKKFFPANWGVKVTRDPLPLIEEFFDNDEISKTQV